MSKQDKVILLAAREVQVKAAASEVEVKAAKAMASKKSKGGRHGR